ncbi:CbiX/SirB N-terminal domain-containing protein [Microbacterium sp. ET2]|uniref:sirohydrochlorin chelatase n=1 Tax=Microbacterium albipurpureum TaxID=3050384 RepID=UPI00259CAA45|nr:CbiX/SirB N-terminal domain-containing protein [Microbacterium sp. ET2 (Ac-2212)]WJL96402.1 CbiX/SirB N-terminal domain-containing protein [Microbacterium sp. ET2 (Ac-2212)]
MTPTLIACSHGTDSPAGRAAIRSIVDDLRGLLPHVDVHEAFVDVQEPALPDVLERSTRAGAAIVVPLLLSTGYHTKVDIAHAVAAHPQAAAAAHALGPHRLLTDILEDRLAAVGLRDDDAIVLAAAGSSDPAAAVDVDVTVRRLAERLGRPVTTGVASGAGPRIGSVVAAARAAGAGRVVVASYVLATGYFAGVIARAGGDVETAPLAPDERLAVIAADRYRNVLGTRAASAA